MIPGLSGATQGLPQVDRSALPADIRKASPEDQQAYKAALGFERMLLGQLSKSMTNAQKGEEGAEEGGAGAPAAYQDMLAEALADNVTRAGGTGLARGLYDTLKAQR